MHVRRTTRSLVFAAVLALGGLAHAGPAAALGAPVGLGTAASYAVLAGTPNVANTGPTTLNGDLGIHPGSSVTGAPVVTGATHLADAEALQAKNDLVTAYDDAAGRVSTGVADADLTGETFVSGVFTGGAIGLTGAMTLDAQGDPGAVFVFQAASTLITEVGSSIGLINGAQACNVFWKVGSSATLKAGSNFVGTVMALTDIQAQTGATIAGRLLARNGAVTLDTNTITRPFCAAAVVPDIVVPPTTSTTSTTVRRPRPTTTTTSTTAAPTTTSVPSTTSTTAVDAGTGVTATGTAGPTGIVGTLVPAGSGGSGSGTGLGTGLGTGGGSSTGLGAPPQLPRTGAGVGLMAVGGLASTGLGALLVRASRPAHQGLHRRSGPR